jgi:hypothetical protein
VITISQTILQPPLNVNESDVITLRGWYTNSFVAGDGITSVQGGDGQAGFYYDIECSLNGGGFVVIPAFDVQETTGSNPTAGFFGQLYINGAPGQMVFGSPQATAGWQLPTVYGDVVSFDQLAVYNAAMQLLYAPITYFTAAQTILEIRRLAGDFDYAAVGVNGIGQPSVDPDDPLAPIFFGANDPAVGDVHGTLTENTVPRASAEKTLSDGLANDDGTDWTVQTLNYVQLGDFGNQQGGTKFGINDTFNLFRLLAARDAAAEYAGVVADATSGDPSVEIQATGYSYLKNTSQGVVAVGDAAGGNNGTTLTVDDVQQLILLTNVPTSDPAVANAIWSDGGTLKISAG